MVEKGNTDISVRRQCELLSVQRSRVYYEAVPETEENLMLMREIDELCLNEPTAGSRTCANVLSMKFRCIYSRKRISRLMNKMGVEAVRPKRKTSIPADGSHVYPYLLKGVDIIRPNQVWCADITYLPMRGSFMYLAAVMDWHSRKILGWSLSNTLDTAFCLDALEMALKAAGDKPEVFNTDQGCQFTSEAWIGRLKKLETVAISMDGKRRWIDNVAIERFWWSLKYEDVYLKCYETVPKLETGIRNYMQKYNRWRPHQGLGKRLTPDMVYYGKIAA